MSMGRNTAPLPKQLNSHDTVENNFDDVRVHKLTP
jgi:hypothetical protein